MFDNSVRLNKYDYLLAEQISKYNINKCDLRPKIDLNKIRQLFPGEDILKISVSRETEINKLEKVIIEFIKKFDIKKNLIINNNRHKNILINVNTYIPHLRRCCFRILFQHFFNHWYSDTGTSNNSSTCFCIFVNSAGNTITSDPFNTSYLSTCLNKRTIS